MSKSIFYFLKQLHFTYSEKHNSSIKKICKNINIKSISSINIKNISSIKKICKNKKEIM